MYLAYNGLEMKLIKCYEYTQEPVYDGPMYLYTLHRIAARCQFNPGATSYAAPLAPGAQPFAAQFPAPVTDVAIRHRLLIPRRQLIIGVGNTVLLRSPQLGFSVDSANGPFPTVKTVRQVSGTKTFAVDLVIETKLRDCRLETSQYPSIFLSHRWEMQHEINDPFFTTRVIRGHVIFDTARLEQANVLPDQYRGAMFHPIPDNFKRGPIQVHQNEDGTAVDYIITDEEQEINVSGNQALNRNVTGIEAEWIASLGNPGFEDQLPILADLISSALHGLGAKEGGTEIDSRGKKTLRHIGAGIAGIGQLLTSAPTVTFTVSVRVQGNRNAIKNDLTFVAMSIINAALNGVGFLAGNFVPGVQTSTRWDLKRRQVEIDMVVKLGPMGTGAAFGVIKQGVRFAPVINNNDEYVGYLEDGPGNPLPPGDSISRGTYLEALAAQMLSDPCSNQPVPMAGEKVNVLQLSSLAQPV